jgi:hypothetical protein
MVCQLKVRNHWETNRKVSTPKPVSGAVEPAGGPSLPMADFRSVILAGLWLLRASHNPAMCFLVGLNHSRI